MKQLLLSFFVLMTLTVSAQKNKATLISSTSEETIISFNFNDYSFKTVTTPRGEASVLVAEKMSAIMDKGAPDLPKYTESIIIPDLANMEVKVLSSDYTEVANVDIAPSKGNFTRDIDPESVPYTYGKAYTKNAFYPGQLAGLNAPYIMRDFRGQALQVFPFQYNPVTKVLRVYTSLEIKVTKKDDNGENPLVRNRII